VLVSQSLGAAEAAWPVSDGRLVMGHTIRAAASPAHVPCPDAA